MMEFCGIHFLKIVFNIHRTEDSFFFIDSIWHKGLSLALNLRRNKTYLCFILLQPENMSEVQGCAGSTPPQNAFSKMALALCVC